jgi:hypothetical protein
LRYFYGGNYSSSSEQRYLVAGDFDFSSKYGTAGRLGVYGIDDYPSRVFREIVQVSLRGVTREDIDEGKYAADNDDTLKRTPGGYLELTRLDPLFEDVEEDEKEPAYESPVNTGSILLSSIREIRLGNGRYSIQLWY